MTRDPGAEAVSSARSETPLGPADGSVLTTRTTRSALASLEMNVLDPLTA
jgi:hypothetical protein